MPRRYQRIIVPLDGSEWSEAVLPNAADIARAHESELILLHVRADPLPEFIDPIEDTDDANTTTEATGLRTRLNDLRTKLHSEDVNATIAIIVGANVAQAIQAYIIEQNVDLVIMASHGRTGLMRLVLGSVAQEVMQSVKVPIMVLRPGIDTP